MLQESFEVTGGNPLMGAITPQGAKNEALQILAAVLLTDEVVQVTNIPDIIDIQKMIGLLVNLGVKVERIDKNAYHFNAANVDFNGIDVETYQNEAKKIRGSVLLIGPLLARYKKAFLPKPGGDKIGRRRLDTHFSGLKQLGAVLSYDPASDHYSINAKQLKGTHILMEEISVTGTANVIMAAVLAEGTTKIYNAACEPYIQQLCRMLCRMGAQIEGLGSNLLTITGVVKLSGTKHRILPDMIEIGSFIGLAAMTQSDITIKDVHLDELGIIPTVFQKLGIQMEFKGDDIHVPSQDSYEIQTFIDGSIMTIYDAPWPGFTPDLISIILVVAIQARGSILIHQKMFESRLLIVD